MSQGRVVVVGGGAMGAATAWALAGAGHPVTLLEQFASDHVHGSSHGSSRIFRFSYEDPHYVDLGIQAQALWRALEEEASRALIAGVGCVTHGPYDVVAPVHAALVARGVGCDLVDPTDAAARWPVLRLDDTVLLEHEAGRADAGAAVAVLHAEAARRGAEVQTGVAARAVRVRDEGVEVVTDAGVIRGDTVVLAAGAWLPGLLRDPELLEAVPSLRSLPALRVSQEQPGYFAHEGSWEGLENLPSFVHLRDFADDSVKRAIAYYGLFTPGRGVKVGEHGTGPEVGPDQRVDVTAAGVRRLEGYVADWLPGLTPAAVSVDSCLYTSTPDEEFLVERHGRVVVCSPCSGHGFKFVPALGTRTAELALGTRASLWD